MALSWHLRTRSCGRGPFLLPQPGSQCLVWAQQAPPQPLASAPGLPSGVPLVPGQWLHRTGAEQERSQEWPSEVLCPCSLPVSCQLEPTEPSPCGASAIGELQGQRKPLQGPITAECRRPFPVLHSIRLISPISSPKGQAWGKKIEAQSCGVYSALQVSFASSCLPHTEKSQTPTQASIISMREKLGMEMGARSLDIFPHTHSFALNIQEFKPVPSKKIFILRNGSSTLPRFNPCYIFLLKEKSKGKKKNYTELNIWQK